MALFGKSKAPSASPTAPVVGELPTPKSAVEITLADGSVFATRIILRESDHDYLDALKNASGQAVAAWMLVGQEIRLTWGHEGFIFAYRVRVREVLDPLPALEVTYVSGPVRTNRRREARSPVKVRCQFCQLPKDDGESDALTAPEPQRTPGARRYESMTRDGSMTAVRFYSPVPLESGDPLELVMTIEGHRLKWPAKVVRLVEGSVFQGIEGWDAVAVWNPDLGGEVKRQWQDFLRQHRWD